MFLERRDENGESKLFLYGHVAKANEHWRYWKQNHDRSQRSLAIFQGAHSYVSPTWYENGGVPTWNYAAVHLYGTLCVVDDPEELRELVIKLSDQYERNRTDPWIPDFPSEMLNAIVGFSMCVDDIQGKYKLSQNKTETDRNQVRQALERSMSENDQMMAKMMRDESEKQGE